MEVVNFRRRKVSLNGDQEVVTETWAIVMLAIVIDKINIKYNEVSVGSWKCAEIRLVKSCKAVARNSKQKT